jgi:hypothetical protein
VIRPPRAGALFAGDRRGRAGHQAVERYASIGGGAVTCIKLPGWGLK